MAEDLRRFLAEQGKQVQAEISGAWPRRRGRARPASHDDLVATLSHRSAETARAERVVPKGLRSFDGQDADFFLALLPGPRDREGLPESIRFWKGRAESASPEDTFRVGVIYGPSGCGKSSLAKAGLLPRLDDAHVVSAYVEATAEDTEAAAPAAAAERLSRTAPARQLARNDRGLAPQAGAQRRQEGAAGAGPVRAVAARPVRKRNAAN